MLKPFQKYAGWKILTVFLDKPSTVFYGRQLAAKLGMSTFTVSKTLRELETNGFLIKEEKARTIFYSMNNNPMVLALKKFHILSKLNELKIVDRFLKVDSEITTLAIYGSFSSGEYNEKSDLDLICITDRDELDFVDIIRYLEKKLNIDVNVKFVSQDKWQKTPDRDKLFYENVVRNYTLLYGTPLAVK